MRTLFRSAVQILILAALAYAVVLVGKPLLMGAAPAREDPPLVAPAQVVYVIDGDTFVARVGGKQEKVRLIGVNAPEITNKAEPYGEVAASWARKMLAGNKVYLEYDVQQRDKYGRLLAYVWYSPPPDRTEAQVRRRMFNAELLLKGYAQVMTVPPNVRYAGMFKEFQKEARGAGRGLWKLEENSGAAAK